MSGYMDRRTAIGIASLAAAFIHGEVRTVPDSEEGPPAEAGEPALVQSAQIDSATDSRQKRRARERRDAKAARQAAKRVAWLAARATRWPPSRGYIHPTAGNPVFVPTA